MKTFWILVAFSLGTSMTAGAVEPLAPVQQGNFACTATASGISRVSDGDAVSGCCSPNSHCVEFLSTTTMDHDSKANRT